VFSSAVENTRVFCLSGIQMSIVAIITAKSYQQAITQYKQISHQADIVEWRLDQLDALDFNAIAPARQHIKHPLIFTLRRSGCPVSESERLNTLFSLLALSPEYLDIESDVPSAWVTQVRAAYPQIKIILSYHDLKQTPDDLDQLLLSMQGIAADIYKIVTYARSSLDVLRMLLFVKRHTTAEPDICLIGHCMGEIGIPSRVLGAVVGNHWHYASVDNADDSAAPGILSVRELVDIYRLPELNAKTSIYALLGAPVRYSQGHVFHNAAFKMNQVNAVYVKFQITPPELADFLRYSRELSFKGFSVTMPLKEIVLDYLDKRTHAVECIDAANTMILNPQSKWVGENTDGVGALDALEVASPVAGKKLLLVGAGGAAKAIAHEAVLRGATVDIVNRTLEKAKALAQKTGGQAYSLVSCQTELSVYDFCVNTIPHTADNHSIVMSLATRVLSSESISMDIAFDADKSPWIEKAKQLGCLVIPSDQMFVAQARLQLRCWESSGCGLVELIYKQK
jgi:3-dehydroquinate dehydratase/shikimate dehydrogenase